MKRAAYVVKKLNAEAEVPPINIILGGGGVQSVNGQTGDVVLTAADVGALPDTTVLSFVYEQGTPSALWTIQHNLGRFPAVTVERSDGAVVIGNVDYIDENTVTVAFSAPITGKAFLN